MKKKIVSQTLLSVCVAWMVAWSLPTFSQNNTGSLVQPNEQFLMIKNESGKAVRAIIAYDKDDNPLYLISKKLKAGQSAKVQLTCGYFYVKYQFNTKKVCDWGKIDVCKSNTIIIKKSCPIEEEDEQSGKR